MSLTLPTVTGYSRFWQETGDKIPYSMTPQSQNGARSSIDGHVARLLKKRGTSDLRAALNVLIGATAGTTVRLYGGINVNL